jgi:hypothetical protein
MLSRLLTPGRLRGWRADLPDRISEQAERASSEERHEHGVDAERSDRAYSRTLEAAASPTLRGSCARLPRGSRWTLPEAV